MSIPTYARFIITQNRNSINETHGVTLYFPKKAILPNNHQEMKMEGSHNSITKVKQIVRILMDEAHKSYQEYKSRKKVRDTNNRKYNTFIKQKEQEEKMVKTVKTSTNRFAELDVMDDEFQPVKTRKIKNIQ